MSEAGLIRCESLIKTYHDGNNDVEVLKGTDFVINPGDKTAIIGPSGSGKSTLLHLLGGLDNPTSGDVCLNNTSWRALSEKKRCRLRNEHLGFIYQFHHLLPEFSALENVAMPLLLSEISVKKALEKAQKMLERVGLSHRISHRPAQLSGGERQRVAIARALVHEPSCVLANEPTGNLDQETAEKVFELMLSLNHELDTALVIVTHDNQLAQRMDNVYHLNLGVLTLPN